MSFECRSTELWDHNLRSVLMTLTSFGLVLFVAILLPTTSMVDNASGQDAEEATEENNTKLARQSY